MILGGIHGDLPIEPTGGAEPPQPETIRVPPGLSAATKADFDKLPKHVQQDMVKWQQDLETAKTTWDQKAERYNRLDSLLAPRRERFQIAGIDDVQAVQALLAAQDYLERSPREGIAYLARQYGVDLRGFASGQPAGQPAQAAPPMPEWAQQLFGKVQSLESVTVQQQQAAQQAARSEVDGQVHAFRSDPKNLYFENVRNDMAALIQSGQARTIQEAYDKAIWASPEIRPLVLRQQQEADQATQRAAAQAKANAARHASGSITGSPSPGASPAQRSNPTSTVGDDLRSAWNEIAG